MVHSRYRGPSTGHELSSPGLMAADSDFPEKERRLPLRNSTCSSTILIHQPEWLYQTGSQCPLCGGSSYLSGPVNDNQRVGKPSPIVERCSWPTRSYSWIANRAYLIGLFWFGFRSVADGSTPPALSTV